MILMRIELWDNCINYQIFNKNKRKSLKIYLKIYLTYVSLHVMYDNNTALCLL